MRRVRERAEGPSSEDRVNLPTIMKDKTLLVDVCHIDKAANPHNRTKPWAADQLVYARRMLGRSSISPANHVLLTLLYVS